MLMNVAKNQLERKDPLNDIRKLWRFKLFLNKMPIKACIYEDSREEKKIVLRHSTKWEDLDCL